MLSRFLEEFVIINVELDEEEAADKSYFERLYLFNAVQNPEATRKYHKQIKEAYAQRDHPIKQSTPEFLIEWTTMNDYWASFDVSILIPAMEKLDASA